MPAIATSPAFRFSPIQQRRLTLTLLVGGEPVQLRTETTVKLHGRSTQFLAAVPILADCSWIAHIARLITGDLLPPVAEGIDISWNVPRFNAIYVSSRRVAACWNFAETVWRRPGAASPARTPACLAGTGISDQHYADQARQPFQAQRDTTGTGSDSPELRRAGTRCTDGPWKKPFSAVHITAQLQRRPYSTVVVRALRVPAHFITCRD